MILSREIRRVKGGSGFGESRKETVARLWVTGISRKFPPGIKSSSIQEKTFKGALIKPILT
jgi:hypothetical protein